MDERQASVASHNQIRPLPKDISAYSIAVEVVRYQVEILEHFQVEIQRASAAGSSEVLDRERVENSEAPCNSLELDVEWPPGNVWIKGHFRNDIGMQVGYGDSSGPIVQLSGNVRGCERRRGGYNSRASRAADVLLRVLERQAHGHARTRVIQDPELRLARPYQAHLIIDINIIGIEDVAGQR